MFIFLDQRVAGLGGDTALVVLIPRHPDVALLSPWGTPAEMIRK